MPVVTERRRAGATTRDTKIYFIVGIAWAWSVYAAEPTTIAEWRFDTPGQMHGWSANRDWPDGGIVDGHWAGAIVGDDPILMGPVLDPPLEVTDRDYVEIRCRCSVKGRIQFFFTQTLEGKYGGFFRDRSIVRSIPSSDNFRTVRLWPQWARFKKIVRLRLDGPSEGTFELEYIAVRRGAGPETRETTWDLRASAMVQRFCDATLESDMFPTPNGLRVVGNGGPPVATIDGVHVPADKNQWLVVRMSASSGPYGGFFFESPGLRGKRYTFPIRADGKMHTYSVWLGDYHLVNGPEPQRFKRSRFRGVIRGFSVIPTYGPDEEGMIESIAFRGEPAGPPLLVVEYCGPADALYRAGRRGPIAVRVRNAGGTPAANLRVEVEADKHLTIHSDTVRGLPSEIGPDEVQTFYADVTGCSPGRRDFLVRLSCNTGDAVAAKGVVLVEPALAGMSQGEVPAPEPIRTEYDIGVYYFPGWWHLHHWVTIPPYAERRPLLGYYDEASPVVADWDIKWAVEHGVDHFVVEWWWNKGRLWGEGFLEKGLLKSRLLSHIKFCVMWNNPEHFEPWSETDFINLTNYWIEKYFPNRSYKRHADGRPVAYVLRAYNFLDDFGAEGMARLMADANERARQAGFPGIYWVACTPRGDPQPYIDAGFEATTLYNFCGQGSGGVPTSPALLHIAMAPVVWGELPRALTPILPISTGFDHRPWFGRTPENCRYGFNPDLFERHLRDAKAYLDARGERGMVIEAWNEWGEGSALGPMAQFGFELLRAIPRVFALEEAVRPAVGPDDVGVYAPQIPGLWEKVDRPPLFAVGSNKAEKDDNQDLR